MKVIEDPKKMQREAEAIRRSGRRIAFVPTMGFLHEGHMALLRKGRELADILVMSIFVNPTQFSPNEDLDKYPRDLERDCFLAKKEGTDIIFHPGADSIYPVGYQTRVRVGEIEKPLCGASRPAHFQGVATVCCKLFNLVKPHFAIFGEKDFQQYLLIERMARDLDMDLRIVPHPIVREADGLAMSSRNAYLSAEERKQAPCLSRALRAAVALCEEGERGAKRILRAVREEILMAPDGKIDYIDMRTILDLRSVEETITGPTLLALALRFGNTRLIDNVVLLRHEWTP